MPRPVRAHVASPGLRSSAGRDRAQGCAATPWRRAFCPAEARGDLVPREAPYAARVAPRLALARGAIRRPFVSIRRVVEVRLDCRLCATEPACDLGDREALLVAVVAGERYRPTALLNAVQSAHAPDDTAARRRDRFVPRTASRGGIPRASERRPSHDQRVVLHGRSVVGASVPPRCESDCTQRLLREGFRVSRSRSRRLACKPGARGLVQMT